MDFLPTDSPAPRTPLDLNIEFRKSYCRANTVGTLKNISLTGAFVAHNDSDLHENDKINVFLHLSGRTRKIPAAVVWHRNGGCGIKFMPASQRDVQIIDDIIYFVQYSRDNKKSLLEIIFSKVG